MSVKYNQYVFLGVKTPYDNDTYEQYQKYDDNGYEEPRKGLCVLYDGMNGKYILIGTIISRSGIDEPIDGPLDLNQAISSLTTDILANLITEKFGIEKPDIRLWLVSHYS